MTPRGRIADARPHNLADRLSPPAARPYARLARLDRPIGWWLLLLPCWWSEGLAAIAAGRAPDATRLALFLVGAVAMRGAGSVWNDVLDRHIDARVERTRLRPLPAGEASVAGALGLAAALGLVGLAVLLQFNRFAVALGVASLGIVAVYPLAKRVTDWPQGVLGLAFAWGGLMGWAAAFGRLDPPAYAVYAAAVAWTVGYDTIYAAQDSRDDAVAGVRSTARLFGTRARAGVGVLYALAAALALAAVLLVGGGPPALLGWAAFAGHLAWQVARFDPADGPRALTLFRANRDAGLLLAAGLLGAAWLG